MELGPAKLGPMAALYLDGVPLDTTRGHRLHSGLDDVWLDVAASRLGKRMAIWEGVAGDGA